jgi:hypothetical protein
MAVSVTLKLIVDNPRDPAAVERALENARMSASWDFNVQNTVATILHQMWMAHRLQALVGGGSDNRYH